MAIYIVPDSCFVFWLETASRDRKHWPGMFCRNDLKMPEITQIQSSSCKLHLIWIHKIQSHLARFVDVCCFFFAAFWIITFWVSINYISKSPVIWLRKKCTHKKLRKKLLHNWKKEHSPSVHLSLMYLHTISKCTYFRWRYVILSTKIVHHFSCASISIACFNRTNWNHHNQQQQQQYSQHKKQRKRKTQKKCCNFRWKKVPEPFVS